MPKPDPATWLSSADVARELGVRPRTVIDMVQKGKLNPAKYQRPGMAGGAISLFDPAEVSRLGDERVADRTEVVPVNGPGPVVRPRPQLLLPGTVEPVPTLPIDRKLFLTLEEAVAYTGLGKSHIAASVPGLALGPHRRMVYRRAQLDQL